MTTEFIVSDMTCNHCVQTITKAIHHLEPKALVHIDLATHKVAIEQAVNPQALEEAIREEGYDVKVA